MTLDELIDTIFNTLRNELLDAGDEFTKQSDLVAAGLDSLALTQLLLSIEEATGVWVDDSTITEESLASTLTLAKLVHEQLSET